jgi:tetratricopeptide (TPR) repeat protein
MYDAGHESKPAITAAISLSSVYKIMGDDVKAENILQSSLETARTVHGDMSSLTATILNNIGILLKKSSDRQAQALIYYEEALKIRTYTLGNQHPDTIISMNNLAELYISMGREKEATKLQEQIIELVNAQMEEESEIDAVNAAISKRNSKNDNTEWKPY